MWMCSDGIFGNLRWDKERGRKTCDIQITQKPITT